MLQEEVNHFCASTDLASSASPVDLTSFFFCLEILKLMLKDGDVLELVVVRRSSCQKCISRTEIKYVVNCVDHDRVL